MTHALMAQTPPAPAYPLHSPRKATIFSAVLPGAGQVYNKKYWKVPVIYAGLGGMYYVISYNQNKYKTYKEAYIKSTDTIPGNDAYAQQYTSADLLTLTNSYRRDRDLSYIITAGIYVLNIIDAGVDAHLFSFNVSDDLSLSIRPGIGYRVNDRMPALIHCSLTF